MQLLLWLNKLSYCTPRLSPTAISPSPRAFLVISHFLKDRCAARNVLRTLGARNGLPKCWSQVLQGLGGFNRSVSSWEDLLILWDCKGPPSPSVLKTKKDLREIGLMSKQVQTGFSPSRRGRLMALQVPRPRGRAVFDWPHGGLQHHVQVQRSQRTFFDDTPREICPVSTRFNRE